MTSEVNKLFLDQTFSEISEHQKSQLINLVDLYHEWNEKINVISRKDIDHVFKKHIIHSLSIAKYINFKKGSDVMDLGTGGGLPGIPLAIIFPRVSFRLLDARSKKISVVKEIITELKLDNAVALHLRAEEDKFKYDYIVSRAVAPTNKLQDWTRKNIKDKEMNPLPNGWIFLKGGDLSKELKEAKVHRISDVVDLQELIDIPEFDTKKLVYIPR